MRGTWLPSRRPAFRPRAPAALWMRHTAICVGMADTACSSVDEAHGHVGMADNAQGPSRHITTSLRSAHGGGSARAACWGAQARTHARMNESAAVVVWRRTSTPLVQMTQDAQHMKPCRPVRDGRHVDNAALGPTGAAIPPRHIEPCAAASTRDARRGRVKDSGGLQGCRLPRRHRRPSNAQSESNLTRAAVGHRRWARDIPKLDAAPAVTVSDAAKVNHVHDPNERLFDVMREAIWEATWGCAPVVFAS